MASATESKRKHKYYLENRERILARARAYHKKFGWSPRKPEAALLKSARCRAKAKGLKFDITVEDVTIPAKCPILGLPLKRCLGQHGGTPNSPSLDRIDNSKGYIKGNVCVISWRANNLKRDGTAAEFRAVARYIERHRK